MDKNTHQTVDFGPFLESARDLAKLWNGVPRENVAELLAVELAHAAAAGVTAERARCAWFVRTTFERVEKLNRDQWVEAMTVPNLAEIITAIENGTEVPRGE